MDIEKICIASFKSMFDERIVDDVNLTPKYIEMLVREHCEPYMIVTQGFTHDLLANALDHMDWRYISRYLKHQVDKHMYAEEFSND